MPRGVYKRLSCEERFESFIHKNDNGCWDWTGCKDKDGYGDFRAYGTHRAHRVAYILYKGSIPKNILVRHTCRNKCVNPEHLELGTNADNMKDKVRDRTSATGVKNHFAKLDDAKVIAFRKGIPLNNKEKYYREQALILNVSRGGLKDIALGRTWKHL